MIKLKKALSATLVLVLSLSLAVPAFAAGSWGLGVQGKSNEKISLPTATYTLRDWNLDPVWNEDENRYDGDMISLEGTKSVKIEDLIGLTREDTIAITASAEGMIDVQAFSDPDGDGVYDQRIVYFPYDGSAPGMVELPYKDGTVRHDLVGEASTTMHLNGEGGFGWGIGVMWSSLDEDGDGWVDFTVSADRLFQYFGPNTVLFFMTMDDRLGWEGDYGWSMLLMDDSQPTAPDEPEQPTTPSGISVTVGGTAVKWTDAAPFINANDRTMVPLRAVADAMGLAVDWDGDARVASFGDGSKTISFPIDSSTASTSGGGSVQMDTAAVLVNERTYAPIRYLAEYFGYEVGWDAAAQTVSLTK